MKVRCNRIISPVDGSRLVESDWLTVGDEYLVVSLLIDPSGHVELRVIDNDGTPSVWRAEMFETTDERPAPDWLVQLGSDGILEIAPGPWLRPGFWEDYFDYVAEAQRDYESELSIIVAATDAGAQP
jgi:hypothetical protein